MGNLLYIVGTMLVFAALGVFLMTQYSFRRHRTRFLAGLISLLLAFLILLVLVLAFLDY